jgi:hypothetical protein
MVLRLSGYKEGAMDTTYIYGSTGNQYIDCRIKWSSTPTTSSNTSKVTATLQYKRNNTGFTTYGTGSFSITIDGTKTSTSKTLTITEANWVDAVSATKTVSHNSDGSKSITISATGSISGTSLDSTNCSGTAKLDTIPRASTISYVSNVTLGNICTVRWTPLSKSFRYKLKFAVGGWSLTTGAIHPNTTSLYTNASYGISIDAAHQFTNSKDADLTVTLYTYSDTACKTQVGSASTAKAKVYIPENEDTLPTVAMSLSPVSSLGSTFNGLYIQGKTKVRADFTGSKAKYSANISSYSMAVSGLGTDSTSPYESGLLPKSGTISVKGTAKDSRGLSASVPQEITVIPYEKPSIVPYTGEKSIVCARCDSEGNLTASGTYLRIKAGRKYSTVTSEGVQKNFCTLRYRYKTESETSFRSWLFLLQKSTTTTNEVDIVIPNVVSSITTSYIVQIGVIDDIGEESIPLEFTIPTDKVTFHLKDGGKGAAFGKYCENNNCVEIAEDWTIKVYGDRWVDIGLSDSVSSSTSNCGRKESGCFYCVENENHVYVAFNCAFTYSGTAITVNANAIPKEYRPARNVYTMCATGGRAEARVLVTDDGYVMVDWIQILSSAEATTSSTVKWIDGYIDYWV